MHEAISARHISHPQCVWFLTLSFIWKFSSPQITTTKISYCYWKQRSSSLQDASTIMSELTGPHVLNGTDCTSWKWPTWAWNTFNAKGHIGERVQNISNSQKHYGSKASRISWMNLYHAILWWMYTGGFQHRQNISLLFVWWPSSLCLR